MLVSLGIFLKIPDLHVRPALHVPVEFTCCFRIRVRQGALKPDMCYLFIVGLLCIDPSVY